jgi:hypothetical protein
MFDIYQFYLALTGTSRPFKRSPFVFQNIFLPLISKTGLRSGIAMLGEFIFWDSMVQDSDRPD